MSKLLEAYPDSIDMSGLRKSPFYIRGCPCPVLSWPSEYTGSKLGLDEK